MGRQLRLVFFIQVILLIPLNTSSECAHTDTDLSQFLRLIFFTHGTMGNSSVPQDGLGDKRQINGLLQEKQRERKKKPHKVVNATKGKPRWSHRYQRTIN